MDPNLESDEIEDSEEDEEDDSDDWTDYSTSISSGSYDDDEYDDFWDSLLTPKFRCTCTKCAILSVIPYLKIKIPDSISKSDVYYLAQYLSKVSETKDVHPFCNITEILARVIQDDQRFNEVWSSGGLIKIICVSGMWTFARNYCSSSCGETA